MKRALIRVSYFIDTDIFQHVSQFESAQRDFFAAHGAELDRIQVMGAGDGNLFYTINKMEDKSVPQPKQTEGLSKKMQEVKKQVNPSLNKNTKPLVNFKQTERPKRSFNPGKPQFGKIRTISMGGQKPQGT